MVGPALEIWSIHHAAMCMRWELDGKGRPLVMGVHLALTATHEDQQRWRGSEVCLHAARPGLWGKPRKGGWSFGTSLVDRCGVGVVWHLACRLLGYSQWPSRHSHNSARSSSVWKSTVSPEASPQFHKKLNSCKNPCGAAGETRTAGESMCRKDAADKTGSSDERNSKGSWTRSSAVRSMRNAWPR